MFYTNLLQSNLAKYSRLLNPGRSPHGYYWLSRSNAIDTT